MPARHAGIERAPLGLSNTHDRTRLGLLTTKLVVKWGHVTTLVVTTSSTHTIQATLHTNHQSYGDESHTVRIVDLRCI